jgi:hypothetical protein
VTTNDPVTNDPVTNGAATGHRATSVVVGAAVAVWDRLAVERDGPGWREIAVGAVFEAEDVVATVAGGFRRAATIARLRTPPRPSAAAAVARLRLARLAERGVLEEDRGRRQVADTIGSLTTAIATAPVVTRVVDVQVDRLIRPLVDAVLDDVLAQLEQDPQRIQALIRGQRQSMVDELVDRIRLTSTAGDAAVGRATARVFRRGGTAAPHPQPTAPTVP